MLDSPGVQHAPRSMHFDALWTGVLVFVASAKKRSGRSAPLGLEVESAQVIISSGDYWYTLPGKDLVAPQLVCPVLEGPCEFLQGRLARAG